VERYAPGLRIRGSRIPVAPLRLRLKGGAGRPFGERAFVEEMERVFQRKWRFEGDGVESSGKCLKSRAGTLQSVHLGGFHAVSHQAAPKRPQASSNGIETGDDE
jgi:hypothetical protein